MQGAVSVALSLFHVITAVASANLAAKVSAQGCRLASEVHESLMGHLLCMHAWTRCSKTARNPPQIAPFLSTFLLLWWIPGAGITTFHSPFVIAGNGACARVCGCGARARALVCARMCV